MPAVAFVSDQPPARVHAALRQSLAALDEARQCAVLWFAEALRRRVYKSLGYASMNQYAERELGFSHTRTGDFLRLARKLDQLPRVADAMARGDLGYTKAREIAAVATPATEERWLEVAAAPRRELARQVKKAKRAAKVDQAQGELLPDTPPVVVPEELPVRLTFEFTPEQEARRAALIERLHKQGGVPGGRAELLLDALAALVEAREPAGVPRGTPPVQIHVHEEPGGVLTVETHAGRRALSRADAGRVRCDAAVSRPGKPNTTTIPPRTRRTVLARDRHRCRAPGCGRTRFLEVHHVKPRTAGGANSADNLLTLCSACHRLWHERRPG